jgi:transcription elongation factor Elf1
MKFECPHCRKFAAKVTGQSRWNVHAQAFGSIVKCGDCGQESTGFCVVETPSTRFRKVKSEIESPK